MNRQETTQKIFNFCQNRYPEINWEQTSYTDLTSRIWSKTDGIGISIEIIGTQLESHVVLGDVSAFISSTERWSGSFKIWLDRKESQFSFKSKRELDTSTDLFVKAKEILSRIFDFIEIEIQTEVTL
ncbi:hypothetical protein [uncultured phage]|nr:hypothetical protein [uncultured phage]